MDSLRQPSCQGTGGSSSRSSSYTAGLDSKGDKQKTALLLHVASKQAIEVFNTFTMTDEEKDSYDAVIAKFEEYCNPKKNETYERFVFNSRDTSVGRASGAVHHRLEDQGSYMWIWYPEEQYD